MDKSKIKELNTQFKNASAQDIVQFCVAEFGSRIALSSSLGAEDQVLTHLLISINPGVKIFTLDTGRLFPETYDLIDRTSRKYKKNIHVFSPIVRRVIIIAGAAGKRPGELPFY